MSNRQELSLVDPWAEIGDGLSPEAGNLSCERRDPVGGADAKSGHTVTRICVNLSAAAPADGSGDNRYNGFRTLIVREL